MAGFEEEERVTRVRMLRSARRALSQAASRDASLVRSLGGLRSEALSSPSSVEGRRVRVRGWVRSVRAQKEVTFLSIGDGSSQHGLQIVLPSSPEVRSLALRTGCSVEAEGAVAASARERPAEGQEFEVRADGAASVTVVGGCADDYPLQKKRHSLEFLRGAAHVRMRSNTVGAAMRVRSAAMMAFHEYFQAEEFLLVTTPVLTPLDCEGAGELFGVRTPEPDFFGRPAFLGVSGQLYAEMAAASLSRVYTFGPTFRAENSHTARHACEFWMLEPEVAHAGLPELLALAEGSVRHALAATADRCAEDLAFCDRRVRPGLAEDTARAAGRPFAALTYTDAVEVLRRRHPSPPEWGQDLGSEHERFLAEEHCGGAPVFVTDYPAAIKPFYMRPNDEDDGGKTVACFDLIAPHVGELAGGSVREDRHDALEARMLALGLDLDSYRWYLDLRRFGGVPHGGFGIGFERFVQMATGIANIRDVLPVPRVPGSIAF